MAAAGRRHRGGGPGAGFGGRPGPGSCPPRPGRARSSGPSRAGGCGGALPVPRGRAVSRKVTAWVRGSGCFGRRSAPVVPGIGLQLSGAPPALTTQHPDTRRDTVPPRGAGGPQPALPGRGAQSPSEPPDVGRDVRDRALPHPNPGSRPRAQKQGRLNLSRGNPERPPEPRERAAAGWLRGCAAEGPAGTGLCRPGGRGGGGTKALPARSGGRGTPGRGRRTSGGGAVPPGMHLRKQVSYR